MVKLSDNNSSSTLFDVEILYYDECEERIRRLFDKALLVFLEEEGSYRPLPLKLGDGETIDLFQLFVLVRERGGFDSVSRRGLWGLVAEKLNLDRLVSSALRLMYFKYLNRMEKWAENASKIVKWENQDCRKQGCYGGILHELGDGFRGLLENGRSQKRNLDMVVGSSSSSDMYRSQKRNLDMVVGSSSGLGIGKSQKRNLDMVVGSSSGSEMYRSQKRNLDMAVRCSSRSEMYRSMKRSRESSHKRELSCVVVSDVSAVSTKVEGSDFSYTSKGDILSMLKWLSLVARSPKDPSQLKYYTGNAYWMQLVRARKALATERDYQEDIDGVTATIKYLNPGITDPDQSWEVIKRVPEGPKHQAQVEEWTGGSISASDTKWLGTLIWPLKNEEGFDEMVGKGRPESCNCDIRNSIECTRFHIAEKRMELKRELGTVFFKWRFNEMGEEVSLRWSMKEEKMFKEMIIKDLVSFWEKAVKCFKGKKRQQLVSYFFNVFMINKRRYQNRVTARHIDSDDEGDFGSVGTRFGSDAVTSSDTMICSQNRQSDEI